MVAGAQPVQRLAHGGCCKRTRGGGHVCSGSVGWPGSLSLVTGLPTSLPASSSSEGKFCRVWWGSRASHLTVVRAGRPVPAGAGVSWECLSLGAWRPAPGSRSVRPSTCRVPWAPVPSVWFCFTREDRNLSWGRHESAWTVFPSPRPRWALGQGPKTVNCRRSPGGRGLPSSASAQPWGSRGRGLPLGHSLALSLEVQGPLPLLPIHPGTGLGRCAHLSYSQFRELVPACHGP